MRPFAAVCRNVSMYRCIRRCERAEEGHIPCQGPKAGGAKVMSSSHVREAKVLLSRPT